MVMSLVTFLGGGFGEPDTFLRNPVTGNQADATCPKLLSLPWAVLVTHSFCPEGLGTVVEGAGKAICRCLCFGWGGARKPLSALFCDQPLGTLGPL